MTTNRIRMRHLRCFLAVAQHGSVTGAANALATVQPSVSRSIREFEDEMGMVLFDRTATGLSLNAAGKTLFAYVANGMSQLDRGVEALQQRMSEMRVTAYVLPNVVRVVMPGAVRRFKELHPEVDLRFLATTGGGLQQYLARGDVDFGFGRLLAAKHMEGMHFEHLFSEPLCFFVRAGHPLAASKSLTIQDIDRHEVVLPNVETIIREEIDRFIIAEGISRFSNLIETISFEFSRAYLAQSDAIVCQPLGAMRRELRESSVVRLDFARGELEGSVGITTPAGRQLSAPAQLLIESIREEVRDQHHNENDIPQTK